MSIHITDEAMSSDRTRHRARLWPVPGHQAPGTLWEVTWLPGRYLERNQAITAMVLAETVASGFGDHTDPQWLHVDGWAAELGLSGPDAVGKISHSETGQPDTRPIPEDPQSCAEWAAEGTTTAVAGQPGGDAGDLDEEPDDVRLRARRPGPRRGPGSP